MHNTPDKGLPLGKSLIEMIAKAKQKQIEENEGTLPAKMRTPEQEQHDEAVTDPRLGGRVFAPRPMGVLAPGVPDVGQGRDRRSSLLASAAFEAGSLTETQREELRPFARVPYQARPDRFRHGRLGRARSTSDPSGQNRSTR
jgi:hypothetical protein